MKEASDRLCREHALSVIENPQGKAMGYYCWMLERDGMPTRYSVARKALDEAISRSVNMEELKYELSTYGLAFQCSPNRKYWTVTVPGWTKPIRTNRLGPDYSRERIMERIYENDETVRYELISGHRRMHACEILGMDRIRCEVMNLSKEEATIMMVESNFQRSKILPSEKAFAYKMRLEAMKMTISRMITNKNLGQNYGGKEVAPQLDKAREHLARSYGLSEEYVQSIGTNDSRKHEHGLDIPGGPVVHPEKTRDAVGATFGETGRTISRYIRLR